MSKKDQRNRICNLCDSGKKFKNCCEPLVRKAQLHLKTFDQEINSYLKKAIENLNLKNTKGLTISRRPDDFTELKTTFYIKNKCDLIKVTAPSIPKIKSRSDLITILLLSLDQLEITELTESKIETAEIIPMSTIKNPIKEPLKD